MYRFVPELYLYTSTQYIVNPVKWLWYQNRHPYSFMIYYDTFLKEKNNARNLCQFMTIIVNLLLFCALTSYLHFSSACPDKWWTIYSSRTEHTVFKAYKISVQWQKHLWNCWLHIMYPVCYFNRANNITVNIRYWNIVSMIGIILRENHTVFFLCHGFIKFMYINKILMKTRR